MENPKQELLSRLEKYEESEVGEGLHEVLHDPESAVTHNGGDSFTVAFRGEERTYIAGETLELEQPEDELGE